MYRRPGLDLYAWDTTPPGVNLGALVSNSSNLDSAGTAVTPFLLKSFNLTGVIESTE